MCLQKVINLIKYNVNSRYSIKWSYLLATKRILIMKRLVIAIILMLVLPAISLAGVYLEIWESMNNEEPIITYHSYENNIWKIEDTRGLSTIIDFGRDKFIVVYEREHIYSVNALSDIIKDMKSAADSFMQEERGIKREAKFKRIFRNKEIINNIECEHYEIYESGNKIEDIWLSSVKFLRQLEELFLELKQLGSPSDEFSKKVNKDNEEIDKMIEGLGFPIKVISYTTEGKIVSEVKYAIEKEINIDDLGEPIGYDKVSIMEVYLRAYGEEGE